MAEAARPSSETPPRKRRRPALSCEQCRRRKIKCDRTYPCGQCQQSKSATCTYSPGSIPLASKLSSINSTNIPSNLANNHVSQLAPGPSVLNQVSIPSRQKSVAAGSTSTDTTSDTSPRPVASDGTHTTWGDSPEGAPPSDFSNSRELYDRIRSLEQKLTGSNGEVAGTAPTTVRLEEGVHGILEEKVSKGKLRGTVSKTRFFGQSHWMYSFGTYDKISCLTVDGEKSSAEFRDEKINSNINGVLEQCKSMARAAKAGPHNEWLMNPSFRDAVPPRHIADKFVNLYFRTNESIHRILHVPSFYREYEQYWENPAGCSSVFILKMLLVMSIGSVSYQDADRETWRRKSLQWVYSAQSWLASPFEKGRLHISGLQVHCLVLISRVNNSIAGDLTWISGGSLIRTAMQMGFHRDPKFLPKMSPLHAELRRRLWTTVLELNCQSSLDSGMMPLISPEDWDTQPPSNFDDIDIDDGVSNSPTPKPLEIFTQTSLQLLFCRSINTRIAIIRHANSFRQEPTYEEVLKLGADITNNLKENNAFIDRVNAETPIPQITQLQRNLLDMHIRRFLLSIHRPYAARAEKDPRFYFSRSVCRDVAMTMLTYPPDICLVPGEKDDWSRLKIMGGGFFKGLLVHAAMVVFSELILLLEEEDTAMNRAARQPLKAVLQDLIDLSRQRIEACENNIKGHLFMSVIFAQVEAMEARVPAEPAVFAAASKSANVCLELLRKRVPQMAEENAYLQHVDNGTSMDAVGVQPVFQQDFGPGMDFSMQDWNMDFGVPDSFLLSGYEDNQPWGLQV